jgi:hypothetical protein
VSILLLASLALAAETGFILRPELQVDLASDRPGEDVVENRTWLRAFARGDTGDNGRWFFEVWGEHQLLAGDDIEGFWDVRPGESGWEGRAGPLRVRAGHLIERWGKLDLLPVVDVINPRDTRNGPLTPTEFSRLPIPMITLEAGSDTVRATTILVPFNGVDRVDQRGTDWSISRQRMIRQFGQTAAGCTQEQAALELDCGWPDGASPALEEQIVGLTKGMDTQDPFLRRGLNVALSQKELP